MRCCNYHWPQILAFRDWTGTGEQGCSGAGIIPISTCPFGLSKFQEVWPSCFEFFQTAKEYLSLRNTDCHRIRNQFEKRFCRLAFPNQVACIPKPTRSLSVLHTQNAAGELERNIYSLSHEASPWRPLICESTTWKLPSKAKQSGRS